MRCQPSYSIHWYHVSLCVLSVVEASRAKRVVSLDLVVYICRVERNVSWYSLSKNFTIVLKHCTTRPQGLPICLLRSIAWLALAPWLSHHPQIHTGNR